MTFQDWLIQLIKESAGSFGNDSISLDCSVVKDEIQIILPNGRNLVRFKVTGNSVSETSTEP